MCFNGVPETSIPSADFCLSLLFKRRAAFHCQHQGLAIQLDWKADLKLELNVVEMRKKNARIEHSSDENAPWRL